MMRLAEIGAGRERARCRIEGGVIVCDTCGKPADTIHFLPWCVTNGRAERRLEAACRNHDPGGYWLEVKDLAERMGDWLAHLATKRERPHAQLIEWLSYAGGQALDGLRAKSGVRSRARK
jgi:hypothetical protein